MKRLQGLGYETEIKYPKKSMWKLIEEKDGLLPTRLIRYCCHELKETKVTEDKKAFLIMGVRWAESAARKQREEFEVIASKPANKIKVKSEDQGFERRLFEECRLKGEKVCNPIIDWTDEDVWEFIKDKNVEVNPLYGMGFTRVGCVCCPFASKAQRLKSLELFPGYKRAYINAVARGIKRGLAKGKTYTWGQSGSVTDIADGACDWWLAAGGRLRSWIEDYH